jgi:hypothetical protein
MNKISKRLLIALITIVVAIIGLKIYVNNEMSNIDWDELNEKYQEQEKKRNENVENAQIDNKPSISNTIEKSLKPINRLFIPVNDNWYIKNEVHETSIDLFNVMLSDNNDKGIISITSQKPHAYIEGLDKLSEYYNEKFVRNLGATGLKLTSKSKEEKDFKGVNANYEYFDSKYTSTGEENKCVAINFIYKDYAYTIFYVITEEAELVIEGIELK